MLRYLGVHSGELIAVPQQLEAGRLRAQGDAFEASVASFRTAFLQVAPFAPPPPAGDDISMAQVLGLLGNAL